MRSARRRSSPTRGLSPNFLDASRALGDALAKKIAIDEALAERLIKDFAAPPLDDAKTAARVRAVAEAVQRVADQWGRADLSLTSVAAVLTEAISIASEVTTELENLGRWQRIVKVVLTTKNAEALTRILRAVAAKNYGQAAADTIEFVADLECGSDEAKSGCTPKDKKALTFIKALVVYVIDAATSPTAPASSEAAFRDAATALIEEAGGDGLLRRANSWGAVMLPELSYRYAIRPGHLTADGNMAQWYPSADLLTARLLFRYTQYTYVSLHVSFIDALGPFSELATRHPTLGSEATDHKGLVFVEGFIVPRLDLEYGIPAFSKHLVVGLGGAFRLYRAVKVGGQPAYCAIFADCPAPVEHKISGNNFEASLFVKYLL